MPLLDSVLGNYAVHAGTALTFAGSTISGGDVGAGTAIAGGYTLTEGEVVNIANLTLLAAGMTEVLDTAMAPRDNVTDILVPEIGGLTFTPGTWYSSTITAGAGATVILDGQGDPNSEFLFQSNTTMLMGAGVKIILINGAKAENVAWALGTTLTVGTDALIEGSILAGTVITFGARTVVEGSILAGDSITFGANTVVEGSVMAGAAITFGDTNDVHGSVVAIAAIVFGASNSVTVPNASPSAASSQSPSSSPTGSLTADAIGADRRRLRGSSVKR
jgi:hypothetical protein